MLIVVQCRLGWPKWLFIFLGGTMKHAYLLSLIGFLTCANIIANPVGETASYLLDRSRDRTSRLIKSGEANAEVASFVQHEKLGPSYVVDIQYDLKVSLVGNKRGSIGLIVPEALFNDQFYNDLERTKTSDLGVFKIDYEGTSSAADSSGTNYEQCVMTRIYDINTEEYPIPGTNNGVMVLWHKSEGVKADVNNLEIKLKIHPDVPVLGAVEIDLSGEVYGFDFSAGFNLVR